MEKVRYLIIGNGIAGLSAVKEIRKNDKDSLIMMVSNEPYLTYYRIKLTEGLEKNYSIDEVLVSKENWYEDNKILVKLNTNVEKLDEKNNKVILDDGNEIIYEKLLIATGSRPFIPPINGINKKGVFSLRTLDDLSNIRSYIDNCETVTMIGGGLLGLEAVWSLKALGKKINVIEFAPYLLPRQLDRELGQKLKEQLQNDGIDIYLSSTVDEVLGDGEVNALRLSGGELIETDAVLISSGIRPNLELVKGTTVQFDRGIDVDNHLRTNIHNIYAAGDVAEFDGVIVGLWTTSNEQGKVAGGNMSGEELQYSHPKLFSSLRIGEIQIFSAGDILGFDQVLEYKVDERNIHHKLYVRNNKIIGVILFGDLKEMNKLKNAAFNQINVEDYLNEGMPFK